MKMQTLHINNVKTKQKNDEPENHVRRKHKTSGAPAQEIC